MIELIVTLTLLACADGACEAPTPGHYDYYDYYDDAPPLCERPPSGGIIDIEFPQLDVEDDRNLPDFVQDDYGDYDNGPDVDHYEDGGGPVEDYNDWSIDHSPN